MNGKDRPGLWDKGIQPGDCVADTLHTLTGQHQEWMVEKQRENEGYDGTAKDLTEY